MTRFFTLNETVPIDRSVDRIFRTSVLERPFIRDIAKLSPTTEKRIATFWIPDNM